MKREEKKVKRWRRGEALLGEWRKRRRREEEEKEKNE
jgi:hypothetical protein